MLSGGPSLHKTLNCACIFTYRIIPSSRLFSDATSAVGGPFFVQSPHAHCSTCFKLGYFTVDPSYSRIMIFFFHMCST